MSDDTASIASRIQAEVERAVQRNIKGIEYLASPGPALGLTPRDVVAQRGTMALYHYRPLVEEIYRVPLLIVMAITNRGYILDLTPGQSLVEFLLKQGYDVFMLDWNPPRPDETRLRLEDYTLDFIPHCVGRVQEISGEDDVNIVGYCMGGMLSTIYSALHPAGPLKNLAVFTTPIDFSEMKLFSHWSDKRYFDVDRLIDKTGNAPRDMIFAAFDMLRPATSVAAKVQLWDNLWNDDYVKAYRMVDRWAGDTLPVPGEFFRQLTKECMWENRLLKNELVIGGRRVDLRRIKVPVLHALAEHDHIVPYSAAKPLVAGIGSKDKAEVVLKGGHVSLVAGGNAIKRLWPKLDSWLGNRSV